MAVEIKEIISILEIIEEKNLSSQAILSLIDQILSKEFETPRPNKIVIARKNALILILYRVLSTHFDEETSIEILGKLGAMLFSSKKPEDKDDKKIKNSAIAQENIN